MTRDRLHKTPTRDERKDCAVCRRPFRCPTAQDERFICGPCDPAADHKQGESL